MKKYKPIFEIKKEEMMIDCENYKSSKYCLVGQYQKEYCNKLCKYYKKEK